jgi:tetratricopeptide (TPR) repeat protein
MERWGGRILTREPAHLAAVFGVGDPDGRDTEIATRCALLAMRSLGARCAPGAGVHIGRIHLSSGGDIQCDERLSMLLDCARELARACDGQVVMSAPAMRQVKALFEFDPLLDSDRPAPRLPAVLVRDVRGPGETSGRFVGRKDELRRIGEILATVNRRTARVITLRGDHGVGKTRLLYEVQRRLRKGGYDVGFHIAACLPRGHDFPFSGIACMLHVLCGTAEGDTQERILAVQPRLRALGLQGDAVNAVLGWLGASVPSPSGNAKALLGTAFARMVQSLCEDRPHTLAWDVAHAMDEESFALLEDTASRLMHARVAFVFAARAGFAHPLEKLEGHTGLDVGDLAPADAERLIALRLGVDSVPQELQRFVRARAGGHPLFVEEVIKALVDGGAVSVGERQVVSMRLLGQDLALPRTLRGLVASRVARLSAQQRTTLQAAAVLGDPIDLAVLATMLGQPLHALEGTIALLERPGFLVRTGPGELRFASPITPEIVVDALTAQACREMHAAAGQALETALGDRVWEQASRIAGHHYEAGDRDRAATYFAKSGERRLETRQLEAAAGDLGRAIALADPSTRAAGELVGWLERLASAVRLVRAAPDANELCGRVVERADRSEAREGRELRVRARVAAGHLLAAVHHLDSARERLAEAEGIAEGDERLTKLVLVAEAELAIRRGDFTRALAVFDALQRIVHAMSDDQEKHRMALHRAQALAGMGDRFTALASLREAERLLPDDRTAAFERTRTRALVDYYTRDWRSAVEHWERTCDMGRELGLHYQVMASLHNVGDVLIQLEDLPRAYGALRQSLGMSEEYGFERLANLNRMFLAYLDGIRGTVDGESLLRQGIAYSEGKHFTNDVVGGRMLLAMLLRRMGQSESAHEEFRKTRAVALSAGHRRVADECERALATLEAAGARAHHQSAE